MTAHARLSPSSRHRWSVCPGSVREEAKYPNPPSGKAATDGTHSHTLLEYCVKNDLKDPMLCVGMEMTDHEGTFTVDADRATRVVKAINYIKERIAEGGGYQVIAEKRVDPAPLLGRDDLGGTADVQIIRSDAGVFEVIDYKDGMNPVSAVGNPQLNQYAVGALAELSTPVATIRKTIIQPKLALKGIDPISTHEQTMDEFRVELEKLKAEAAATDDPNAPLVPGDVQCRWCRAKGGCSALATHALNEVQVMFQDIDMAKQAADKDPAQLDDQQIRDILEAAPLLRQMLEAVESEALRRFESGHDVPGLKLVRGRGSRNWALSEDEMADKLKRMGMPKSVIYQTKLVSPAQAAKVTWEKRDGTKKQLSERQIKTLEKEYIAKKTGKLIVVPESDSREAVATNAAPMFGAVSQEAAPGNNTPDPASELPAWMK